MGRMSATKLRSCCSTKLSAAASAADFRLDDAEGGPISSTKLRSCCSTKLRSDAAREPAPGCPTEAAPPPRMELWAEGSAPGLSRPLCDTGLWLPPLALPPPPPGRGAGARIGLEPMPNEGMLNTSDSVRDLPLPLFCCEPGLMGRGTSPSLFGLPPDLLLPPCCCEPGVNGRAASPPDLALPLPLPLFCCEAGLKGRGASSGLPCLCGLGLPEPELA
mmetsp:Transcript_57827/g.187904  ORF Transcript_57827/g.187904 Transcript_57827/m.187904 type:complete len:218 (-) Transcript_57827:401-1054(-)